ncbi:hypothetical protein JD969_19395 [Planctomycetota bacterium]|nr:hypothetical protein JD969_19395 [Planctomycetota bacterium]
MNTFITFLGAAATPPPVEPTSNAFLIWGIVLIAVALVLFVIELLIPTAGIVAILSILSLIIGIAFLFNFNTLVGTIACLLTLFAIPFLIGFGIKIWPHTFIAKWVTLKNEKKAESKTEELLFSEVTHDLQPGMIGETITPLRPVGTCVFNKHRIECIAEAGIIDQNTKVEITLIDGMQIKVKPYT